MGVGVWKCVWGVEKLLCLGCEKRCGKGVGSVRKYGE